MCYLLVAEYSTRQRRRQRHRTARVPGPYHPCMTDLDPRALRALVLAMPKAELHLHLDGSLRVETALDIVRTRGLDAPRTYQGMRGVLVGPEQADDLRDPDAPHHREPEHRAERHGRRRRRGGVSHVR